jgi:hypothetical protein
MSRFKIGAFGLLTMAGLLMVVPASALAAPKHGHPGGPTPIHVGGGAVAYGSVTSTGTGTFVLTTPGSSGTPYTIGTTADTKFVAVNPTDGATFQANDAVLAAGAFVNGFTARVVWYDSSPFALPGGHAGARGTGVSISATQLVITDRSNNTDTFTLNSSTKFSVNGKPTAASSVSSVTGDMVEVQTQTFTDGSVVAVRVAIRLPKP